MTGTSGRFRLRQKLKSAHSGHVDVGQDQNQRCARGVADTLQGAISGLSKIHRKAAGAEVAPKLLAKQIFDIVIRRQRQEQGTSFICSGFARGRHPRKNYPEFGELAGPGVDLDRSGVLLDDNIVAEGEAKARAFRRAAWL